MLLALALAACAWKDALDHAPYVLVTGLGDLRAIAPGPSSTAYATTSAGVIAVTGDGKSSRVLDGDTRLIAVHKDRLFAMQGDALRWVPIATAFEGAVGGSQPMPGVVDLVAWCESDLLVAYADHLALWRIGQEAERPFGEPIAEVRGVALGSDDCSTLLVLTADAVWSTQASGPPRRIVRGLVEPRAVASDALGRVWVVSGEPPSLGRVEAGSLVPVAKRLGDVKDFFFGHQGLYSQQNAYLAEGDGQIEYVHVDDIPTGH
jgi:hypothetical protein